MQNPGDIVHLTTVLSVVPSFESVYFQHDDLPSKVRLMMIAFITFKSSLVPLFEGL